MKSWINIFSFLLFTFLISGWYSSFANNKDSLNNIKKDTLNVFFLNETNFDYKNFDHFFKRIDTSLTGIQKYELLTSENPFIAKFSNSGLAYRNLNLNTDYSFDFISSRQYFKDYFFDNNNAKYYNTYTPFADAYYVNGSKHDQFFDIFFTRNIKKNLNISIQYKIIHSIGAYQQQESNNNFVILTSNYATKNKRYVALGNYFYNRMKVQENGGLVYNLDFTEVANRSRSLDSVNLNSDNNAINRVKESGFYLKQFLFLGFYGKQDTTKKEDPKFFGFGRISHSLFFENQNYSYTDNDPSSGFYPVTLLNNVLTHDSVHINTIENTLSWSNLKFKNTERDQHFLLQFGIKYKISKLHGISTDTTFHSIIPQADLKLKFGKVFELYSNELYIVNGYNKGDFSANGTLKLFYTSDSLRTDYFAFKAEMFQQSPEYFDEKYSSNNFYWNYKFNAMDVQKANFLFNYHTFGISASYSLMKNYVYFDNFARPKQFDDYLEIAQASLYKNFKWKILELDNKIVCQKSPESNIIHLPELMSNHAFYINGILFKKALLAQLGFEVTFFSSYYPLAWMPDTKEFYLQNNYKSANYPYVDFFLNCKIKRARIYLKLDHLNAALSGYNYYMIPNYPMSDMVFRFGVSWIFYN